MGIKPTRGAGANGWIWDDYSSNPEILWRGEDGRGTYYPQERFYSGAEGIRTYNTKVSIATKSRDGSPPYYVTLSRAYYAEQRGITKARPYPPVHGPYETRDIARVVAELLL